MTPDLSSTLTRFLLGSDEKQRSQRIVLLASVVLGLGLRIYEYALRPPTLWQDEAYWAVKVLTTEAIDAQIRPLGFMLVTQFLLHVCGAAAWVYRLLPFVGSLVSMSLAPYVVLRLFRKPWSQTLAVLLLALSPVALEMSAEFKHYGVEIGVYVGVLAALLSFRERGTAKSLALLLGAAWFGFFFSITIIFFYPALFGVLAWEAWRSKRWRQLFAVVAVVALCLGTITTIYFTTWRTISAQKAEQKWGTWYDVFYIKNGLRVTHDSRLAWTTAKYFELAAIPSMDRVLWKSDHVTETTLEKLKSADLVLWGALHVAGLAWLVRKRRFAELLWLWSPLLMVTLFNLAGRWPGGAFRSNTFYLPFAILISSFSGEWLSDVSAGKRRLAVGLTAALFLPTLLFHRALTEKGLWAKPGAFTQALRLLPPDPPKHQRRLIMDFESCRPWDYYTVYDQPFSQLGSRLRRHYDEKCLRTGKELSRELDRLRRTPGLGFSYLLTDPRKFSFMERLVKQSCPKASVQYVHGATHLLLRCVDPE